MKTLIFSHKEPIKSPRNGRITGYIDIYNLLRNKPTSKFFCIPYCTYNHDNMTTTLIRVYDSDIVSPHLAAGYTPRVYGFIAKQGRPEDAEGKMSPCCKSPEIAKQKLDHILQKIK